jgi:hypothetical protein
LLAHLALMAEWRNAFGRRAMLLRDVVEKCEERTAGDRIGGAMPYAYPELRSAVRATNPEAHRVNIDVNALGLKMRGYKDRWVDSMRFVKMSRYGDNFWTLEEKAGELRRKHEKAPNKKAE